jgi:3-phenylpropionate/trans-cinnamate dioxygenase ferredoxin reductase subunit
MGSQRGDFLAVSNQVVIVGAGHGAGQVVASLRQKKYAGRIVLIGEEPWLPYQRPPLSKKFLAGELTVERLYVKPATFYDEADIEVHLDTRVGSIDLANGRVIEASGKSHEYSDLVLATGSRVRRLNVPGSDLEGIHYLRDIDDVEAIRTGLETTQRLVVVGAGYIGLEVAAVARQLGRAVTVVEMADRVMSRVVSEQVSEFYQSLHTTAGVVLKLGTGLKGFAGEGGKVTGVETVNGEILPADQVVVGVGILPNTELAAEAGLLVDNGIVVDERCRTASPGVYAIGDCTAHPNRIYERRLRLESVQNALEQAKVAAANICGEDMSYDQVPWFWSDQYDVKLQIVGLAQGYDRTVQRGDPADRSFSCIYLRDGRMLAIDAVNAPRDFMQAKKLIADRACPDPVRLADPAIPLRDA